MKFYVWSLFTTFAVNLPMQVRSQSVEIEMIAEKGKNVGPCMFNAHVDKRYRDLFHDCDVYTKLKLDEIDFLEDVQVELQEEQPDEKKLITSSTFGNVSPMRIPDGIKSGSIMKTPRLIYISVDVRLCHQRFLSRFLVESDCDGAGMARETKIILSCTAVVLLLILVAVAICVRRHRRARQTKIEDEEQAEQIQMAYSTKLLREFAMGKIIDAAGPINE